MKARAALFVVLVVVSFGIALFVVGLPSSTSTSVAGTPNGVMEVDCNGGQIGIQSECEFQPGESFAVQIYITEPPSVGYVGFQASFQWDSGVINYLPAPSASDETLWPECDIGGRSPEPPTGAPPQLYLCQAFPLPEQPFMDTGVVLEFDFQCKAAPNASPPAGIDANESKLALIPGETSGTNFSDVNLMSIEAFVANAIIRCGDQLPTPTPLSTPPTPAPTPTPTPANRWDVDEDRIVSIIDVGIVVLHFGEETGTTVPVVEGADGAMAVDCDASRDGVQRSCTYAPGESFSVQVFVTEAPSTGYVGFQALFEWTSGIINYQPAVYPSDEERWRDCDIPARSPEPPTGVSPQLFACQAFPFPHEPLVYTGEVLEFDFSCKGVPKTFTQPNGLEDDQSWILLLPGALNGSYFLDITLNSVEPTLVGALITCRQTSPLPRWDVDEDGIVSILDVGLVVLHFGEEY